MKNGLGLLVCALSLLAFASTAQSDNGDASGTFTFDLGTATGTVNFAGHLAHKDDPATGQISFNATVDVSGETCQPVNVGTVAHPIYVDVCEPTGNDPANGVTMSQQTVALNFLIDRMVISNNRAAMSGIINDESSPFYKQHTILAVESASGNDLFTWGVYKKKIVNTTATDFDFCQGPPDPGVCENSENCPTPTCFFDGRIIDDQSVPSYMLPYPATDYELCLYPPPSDTQNNVPPDPHNYVCFDPNAPSPPSWSHDPNGYDTGIPILADTTHTLTNADSFPLFTYPMTPIPHGGGNKLTVKDNG